MDATSITNATVIVGAATALLAAVRAFRDAFVRAVATLLGRPELDEWWKTFPATKKRLFTCAGALTLAGVTYYFLPGSPGVEIAAHCPNTGCAQNETFTVKWRNLTGELAVCVVVYSPDDSTYFPQQVYAPGVASGTLNAVIELGASSDNGRPFQVGAWLLDKQGQEVLRNYLSDPFRAGFDVLPSGSRFYEVKSVRRALKWETK
jgi:hypothetical protein